MTFYPNQTYWTIDSDLYSLLSELLTPEELSGLLDGFEKVGDTYYAPMSAIDGTEAALAVMEENGISLGMFDYKKSTQSNYPF